MKFFLVFALTTMSLAAMAECYDFKGYGPQELGEAIFTQTPKVMCINQTPKFTNIELRDNAGVVARIEATIRRERSPQGEITADLGMATVNGLVEDYRGMTLTIKRGMNFRGQREVIIGNKSYNITAK